MRAPRSAFLSTSFCEYKRMQFSCTRNSTLQNARPRIETLAPERGRFEAAPAALAPSKLAVNSTAESLMMQDLPGGLAFVRTPTHECRRQCRDSFVVVART